MLSIENAERPFDFAYLASRRMREYGPLITYYDLLVDRFGDYKEALVERIAMSRKLLEGRVSDPWELAVDYCFYVNRYERLHIHDEAVRVLEKATEYALQEKTNLNDRAYALAFIANEYIKINEKAAAAPLLDMAYSLTSRRRRAQYHFDHWGYLLAEGYINLGRFMKARKVLKKLEKGDLFCAFIRLALAEGRFDRKTFTKVKKMLFSHLTAGDRDYGLSWIVKELAQQGLVDDAVSLIPKIKDPGLKADALTTAAVELFNKGEKSRAEKILSESDACYRDDSGTFILDDALSKIIVLYLQVGNREAALSIADHAVSCELTNHKDGYCYERLCQLVELFANAEINEKAEELIDQILPEPLHTLEPFLGSAAGILFRIACVIGKYDLRFDEQRIEVFRRMLSMLPELLFPEEKEILLIS